MARVVCPEPGSQVTLPSVTVPPMVTSNTARIESIEDVARAAICSIGSYDRGLQDYYQQRLNAALAALGRGI